MIFYILFNLISLLTILIVILNFCNIVLKEQLSSYVLLRVQKIVIYNSMTIFYNIKFKYRFCYKFFSSNLGKTQKK
jgi:hypothetical protein